MTDNERIKLLEACVKFEDCEKCPRYEECEFFYDREYIGIPDVLIFSLDLIKSQKAEIERLNKEVDRLSQVVLYHDGHIADAKSEAIKEFAEKLKEEQEFHVDECDRFVGFVAVSRIDNLVEEMEKDK